MEQNKSLGERISDIDKKIIILEDQINELNKLRIRTAWLIFAILVAITLLIII
jgi:hypothetical protein